jgi:hypothetical protein
MERKMRRLVRISVMAIFVSASIWAEEIQLKNGTKITGKLTGISGDNFQVKTAYGDMKVPRSDVVTITFPENQTSKTKADDAVASIDESLEGTTYINRTSNFEATVPADWVISPELRKTSDIVAALKSADATLFFLVTQETYAGKLSTYQVLVETEVQSKFKDYQKLAQSEIQLDGRNGTRIVFQATSRDNNILFKFVVYILPYDGHMMRLTFFTLEPFFNEGIPTFEKIAASYHTVKTGSSRATTSQ